MCTRSLNAQFAVADIAMGLLFAENTKHVINIESRSAQHESLEPVDCQWTFKILAVHYAHNYGVREGAGEMAGKRVSHPPLVTRTA